MSFTPVPLDRNPHGGAILFAKLAFPLLALAVTLGIAATHPRAGATEASTEEADMERHTARYLLAAVADLMEAVEAAGIGNLG